MIGNCSKMICGFSLVCLEAFVAPERLKLERESEEILAWLKNAPASEVVGVPILP